MDGPGVRRGLRLLRTYQAPPELVYRALTEPQQLARWWAPDGYLIRVLESDPRPNGRLRLTRRGPDGLDRPLEATYAQAVPPRMLEVRASIRSLGEEARLRSRHTIRLEPRGDSTELALEAEASALVSGAEAMLVGLEAGWSQSLQRLEDVISGALERQIVLSRTLPVPPEEVFRLFTERDLLASWWPPLGFQLSLEEMDVRPGGTWQFQLRGLDGRSRRRTLVYDELRPPQRLVYSDPIDRWRCVLTFDELGGATALGLRRVYPGPRERDRAVAEDNALGDSVEMVDRLLRRVVVKGARD